MAIRKRPAFYGSHCVLIVAMGFAVLASSTRTTGATFVVSPTGGDDTDRLQAAFDAAVAAGVFHVSGPIVVGGFAGSFLGAGRGVTIPIGAAPSLLVPVASAQSESPLRQGARVRITAPSVGKRPLVGTLVGIENDTLKLDVEGALERQVVPRSAVTKLEFSQGLKRNTAKGAWIGLATGAVAGGALAAAYAASDEGPVNAGFVPLVAGAYGAAGMALGALVGAMVKSERWRETDLEGPLVSVGPVPGGGVGFSVHITVGRSR